MACAKTLIPTGVCFLTWIISTAGGNYIPEAENVHWFSLDFTTILTWTVKPSEYKYTVLYSMDEGDWIESPDCIQISETECDLTNILTPLDRSYTADIQTESAEFDDTTDEDDLPHTFSSHFNPYRESNISAVKFTVQAMDDTTVRLIITDPITAIHQGGKQLSIRDILRNDLKYKINYYKAASTGKREVISDSSIAEVSKLDAGESYCFIVAAFIPSRAKPLQQGAWSTQQCTQGNMQGLSVGALVGIIFIVLTVVIVTIIVSTLCCRCCQRNKSLQITQTSAPV
ncbi:tissue factor-like [Gouania willdenowi]|uniref:Tissue factor n=1 Tax=Gouania willdenowi TaxID=441366 RepID=A0A8C5GGV7_GOUWI|nr:tissue factor-like [Gouania willdenowi]